VELEGLFMRGLVLAIALVLLPLPVLAQSALSTDSDLQQQIRQKRIIVQPRPSPDVIQRDADQAIDELAAERRVDGTLRDINRPMPRRPDLTEPVQGGIQTRELNKALRR
jgi:hypothetical protein